MSLVRERVGRENEELQHRNQQVSEEVQSFRHVSIVYVIDDLL